MLGHAMGPAAIGIGLVVSAALTRLMAALLFGESALSPMTCGAVAGILAAVALTASYVPARRAASIDRN